MKAEQMIVFFKKHYKVGLQLIMFGVVIHYIVSQSPDFKKVLDFSLINFSLASLAVLSSYVLSGIKLKVLISVYNVKLPWKDCFGMMMVVRLGNLIFFKAGTANLIVYLAKNYKLRYEEVIASLLADKVFNIYGLLFFGFFVSACFTVNEDFAPYAITSCCLFLAALTSLSFLLSRKTTSKKNLISRQNKVTLFLLKILESCKTYRGNRAKIATIISLHILSMVIWGFRLYVAFRILSYPVTFINCLVLSFCLFVSGFIAIVPGNIGVREATVGAALTYLSSDFNYGVFAAALDRAIAMFWVGVLGSFWLLYFNPFKNQKAPDRG